MRQRGMILLSHDLKRGKIHKNLLAEEPNQECELLIDLLRN
jgi:hypothetical protein